MYELIESFMMHVYAAAASGRADEHPMPIAGGARGSNDRQERGWLLADVTKR